MKRLLAVLPIVVFAAACNDAHITQPDPLDSSQIGASARAWGGPTESQRLRGLGGRVFAVHVDELSPPGPGFDNCYTFLADGTFVDPLFFGPPGVPGTWTQHSVGAATTYTATAGITGVVTLVQEGKVKIALREKLLPCPRYDRNKLNKSAVISTYNNFIKHCCPPKAFLLNFF